VDLHGNNVEVTPGVNRKETYNGGAVVERQETERKQEHAKKRERKYNKQ
jgi:hypothetical protein